MQSLATLAKHKLMQLQLAADPPKTVAAGERAAQVDGDYTVLRLPNQGLAPRSAPGLDPRQ
jgi:hypothetical protein